MAPKGAAKGSIAPRDELLYDLTICARRAIKRSDRVARMTARTAKPKALKKLDAPAKKTATDAALFQTKAASTTTTTTTASSLGAGAPRLSVSQDALSVRVVPTSARNSTLPALDDADLLSRSFGETACGGLLPAFSKATAAARTLASPMGTTSGTSMTARVLPKKLAASPLNATLSSTAAAAHDFDLSNRRPLVPKSRRSKGSTTLATGDSLNVKKLAPEDAGPTNWSISDVAVKYRDEGTREEVYQASRAALALAEASKDKVAIGAVVVERHPLHVHVNRAVASANDKAAQRARNRFYSKRFVTDVHQIWLTNMAHLEAGNADRSRRHARIDQGAVLGGSSQVASCSKEHSFVTTSFKGGPATLGEARLRAIRDSEDLLHAPANPSPKAPEAACDTLMLLNGERLRGGKNNNDDDGDNDASSLRAFVQRRSYPAATGRKTTWRFSLFDRVNASELATHIEEDRILEIIVKKRRRRPSPEEEEIDKSSLAAAAEAARRCGAVRRSRVLVEGAFRVRDGQRDLRCCVRTTLAEYDNATEGGPPQVRVGFCVVATRGAAPFLVARAWVTALDVISQLGLDHCPCASDASDFDWWARQHSSLWRDLTGQLEFFSDGGIRFKAPDSASQRVVSPSDRAQLTKMALELIETLTVDTRVVNGDQEVRTLKSTLFPSSSSREGGDWDWDGTSSLTMRVLGHADRCEVVPGCTHVVGGAPPFAMGRVRVRVRAREDQDPTLSAVKKKKKTLDDDEDFDKTRVVGAYMRDPTQSRDDDHPGGAGSAPVVVHLGMALDVIYLVPAQLAWIADHLTSPSAIPDTVLVAAGCAIPATRGRKHPVDVSLGFLSPVTNIKADTVLALNGLGEVLDDAAFDALGKELKNYERRRKIHDWAPSEDEIVEKRRLETHRRRRATDLFDRRRFRRVALSWTSLANFPMLENSVFALTAKAATANRASFTGRYAAHSDESVRDSLVRTRDAVDYLDTLIKKEHAGANDPGFYSVFLAHLNFDGLHRSGFDAAMRQANADCDAKERAAKESTLAKKIRAATALVRDRDEAAIARMAAEMAQQEQHGTNAMNQPGLFFFPDNNNNNNDDDAVHGAQSIASHHLNDLGSSLKLDDESSALTPDEDDRRAILERAVAKVLIGDHDFMGAIAERLGISPLQVTTCAGNVLEHEALAAVVEHRRKLASGEVDPHQSSALLVLDEAHHHLEGAAGEDLVPALAFDALVDDDHHHHHGDMGDEPEPLEGKRHHKNPVWRRLHRSGAAAVAGASKALRLKMASGGQHLAARFKAAHTQGAVDSRVNTVSSLRIVGSVHPSSSSSSTPVTPLFNEASASRFDSLFIPNILEDTVRALEAQVERDTGIPGHPELDVKTRLLTLEQGTSALAEAEERHQHIEGAVLGAKAGDADRVEEMLDVGVAVEEADEFGNTLLILAVQTNSKKVVKVLLRRGADINAQNAQGNTCLHFCHAYSYTSLAEYLVNKGADDDLLNLDGLTCYEGLKRGDLLLE